jgi:hypothetical protein
MRHLRRPRCVASALAAVLAVVAVQLTAAVSSATASAVPVVTVSAPEVDGSTVTIGFEVDRFERSIGSADCTLTDSALVVTSVGCGDPSQGSVKKATVYSTTLADLPDGDYVFGVTVTMAHGERSVTATESFTIPTADASTVCAALDDGVFVADLYWWQKWNCDFTATSGDVVVVNTPVFEQFCIADGGVFHGGGAAPGTYSFGCWIF